MWPCLKLCRDPCRRFVSRRAELYAVMISVDVVPMTHRTRMRRDGSTTQGLVLAALITALAAAVLLAAALLAVPLWSALTGS